MTEDGGTISTAEKETSLSQPEYPRLDPDTIRTLWSRTYDSGGKPDWSHLIPYYHPDIVFRDCIQRLEGRESFESMCERLARRCKELDRALGKTIWAESLRLCGLSAGL